MVSAQLWAWAELVRAVQRIARPLWLRSAGQGEPRATRQPPRMSWGREGMDERHLRNELMKAVAEEAREFTARPYFPGLRKFAAFAYVAESYGYRYAGHAAGTRTHTGCGSTTSSRASALAHGRRRGWSLQPAGAEQCAGASVGHGRVSPLPRLHGGPGAPRRGHLAGLPLPLSRRPRRDPLPSGEAPRAACRGARRSRDWAASRRRSPGAGGCTSRTGVVRGRGPSATVRRRTARRRRTPAVTVR